MNNYISPWHIFYEFKGAPQMITVTQAPEIYYS